MTRTRRRPARYQSSDRDKAEALHLEHLEAVSAEHASRVHSAPPEGLVQRLGDRAEGERTR